MYRNYIKWFLQRSITRFLGVFCKRKDQVLFESFSGKQYSDNPKAISEKLHEMYPNIGIIWILGKNNRYKNAVPNYVKKVHKQSFSSLKALASSKCFVSNGAGLMPTVYKREDQYFISTWHGDRGFKRVIFDIKNNPLRKKSDVRYQITDIFIVASEYGIKRCKDSFLYDGEIMCEGMPRNDVLVSQPQEKIKSIKSLLSIDADRKILLYAPTFRGANQKQKIEVNLNAVLSQLNEKGENWVCLVRSHSASAGFSGVNGSWVDVSTYPDMADLLLISDMLITDYSSSAGDFILKNKPVILTHFDLEEYNREHREFRFLPKDAGFFCVYNNEELLDLIGKMTDKMAIEECEKLKAFYGVHETGKSAELVCQRIAQFIDKSNKN